MGLRARVGGYVALTPLAAMGGGVTPTSAC